MRRSFDKQLAGYIKRISDTESVCVSLREEILDLKLTSEHRGGMILKAGGIMQQKKPRVIFNQRALMDAVEAAGSDDASLESNRRDFSGVKRHGQMSMGGPDGDEITELVLKVQNQADQINKILSQQKFEWSYPTEAEMKSCRLEYRNQYGYSVDFI